MKEMGKVFLLLIFATVLVFGAFAFQTPEVTTANVVKDSLFLTSSDGRTKEVSFPEFLEKFGANIPQKYQPLIWDEQSRSFTFAKGHYVGYWANYGGCQGIEVFQSSNNSSVNCFEQRHWWYLLH